jgi:allantoin racemase
MKIRILSIGNVYGYAPGVSERVEANLATKKDPDTEIIRRQVKRGTTLIASRADKLIAGYNVVVEALQARTEIDFDAIFVGCFADTGIVELRELFDVPVMGPYQACVHVAALLGRRFSIVTVSNYARETMEDLAAYYGVKEKLASVRYLEMTPLELGKHVEEHSVADDFVQVAKQCVEEDGADVILPGCGYFSYNIDNIRAKLTAVVLDPTEVPIRMLETLVKMRLRHSKTVYPAPAPEHLQQYKL